MWLYADYLEVRKDFIPVFSEEQDRNQPAAWKFFIPHGGLREILHGMIRALERGSAKDKLSLWMHGAYGTGKTFAAFVLKHLLEDDLAEVEDYFRKHQKLLELWPRLKALRERGRYLVVYRSGSAHITSSLKLLVEIQQGIKEKLKEKGYGDVTGETLYDAVVRKLADPRSTFDWPKAFERYRGKFLDFSSAEDVLDKLKAGDVEQTVNLVERVARVLENEGFIVQDDPQSIKNWLKEIIRQNSLAGILFIWDEFTDFFTHNIATSTLQELAHATAESPFYLFLITHKSPQTFQRIDEDTKNRLLERFHNFHFEMKPVTAYQLMANAIEVKKDAQQQWEIKKESLWSRVQRATVSLLGDEARMEDFKGLIPLHPFAAFLLATISRQFSSSQRTLFRFLKEDVDNSFIQFIKNYPQNNWFWLTADILWDYFFRDDNPELTERIRDIMGYYHSRLDFIGGENERKVFKVLMLLFALERQMPGEIFLLQPTRASLELLFADTPVAERLKDIIQNLKKGDFIRSLSTASGERFTIPSRPVDERKLEDIRKQFKAAFPFEKIITPTGEIGNQLVKIFALDGAASRRQKLTVVSLKELKFRRERVEPALEPYQIGNVLVVVQDEGQLEEAESLAAQLSGRSERAAYLVLQAPFSQKKWEEWIDYKAHQKYCSDENDRDNAKYYAQQMKNIVENWLTKVSLLKHKGYFGGEEIEIIGQAGYKKYFQQLATKVFPCGPEQLTQVNTLYATSYGKVGAEIGLGIKTNIIEPYKSLVFELKKEGFWEGDGFVKKPEHFLSRMKQEIERIFATDENVRLMEIWETLQAPPYGLVPSPVAITLLGCLLRDYGQGYYYWDGNNCFPLNPNKLAELIEGVMKGRRGCDEYEIRRSSPEGERFCELIREIFGLPTESTAYPEEARKALRNSLTAMGYPIWALQYVLKKNDPDLEDLNNVIYKLGAMLSVSENENLNLGGNQLKDLVNSLIKMKARLKELVSRENFAAGMKNFFAEKQPGLLEMLERLKIDLPSFMRRLRLTLNEESWLWQESQVSSRLPELYAELELLEALNQLCAAENQDFEKAINYFNDSWLKAGKLPLKILAEVDDISIKRIFSDLDELISTRGRGFGKKIALAEQLKAAKHEIRQALKNQTGALQRWIRNNLGQDITFSEAQEIYRELPELSSENNLEEIKRIVQSKIDALGKRKLLQKLKEEWMSLTQSETPSSWSRKQKVPVRWVLEGPEYAKLFSLVNHPETKTQDELQEALDFLREHAEEIKMLDQESFINDKFLSFVAKDYKELFQEKGDVEDLKQFLYDHLGEDVFNWHERLNKVNELVNHWLNDYYQRKAFPQVLNKIDNMPETQVKNLLKLLAKNPLVGNLLLRGEKGIVTGIEDMQDDHSSRLSFAGPGRY
ncbi:hypothetical protein SAMN02745218_01069 [Desulfofundulus australicus DSM 11792]|uniref:ATP-binding protein n=1 Tax=Desulfofundulus australicus DSM 11792 TaxID=1121425 RepID=A0A1M4XF53_9FIRM|nr:hypothetical protein SAMN02745218_01069 [Desulfofundulus australicus DSM 11792]